MAEQQLIQSFYNSISSHNLDQILSFFSEDGQFKDASTDETYRGKNEIRRMAENWLRAFPDGKFQVQKVIGSGDDWSVEMIFSGTHQGPLNGPTGEIPASGKKVSVPSNDVLTLKNGKIQSLNCYMAIPVLLGQVGAMPMRKAA